MNNEKECYVYLRVGSKEQIEKTKKMEKINEYKYNRKVYRRSII